MKHFGFKKWFNKHNRTLAGCVAIIIFSAIMIAVIYYTIVSRPHLCKLCPKRYKKSIATYDSSCTSNGCDITCQSIDENKVEELIKDAIPKNCLEINVRLRNTNFAYQTILSEWLKGLEVNIKVLEFYECPIATIKPGAFKAKAFKSLEELIIYDGRIAHLQQHSFQDLQSLRKLVIEFRNLNTINSFQADYGVFNGLKSLTTVRLGRFLTDPSQVNSLFGKGNSNLQSLTTIDLSSNELRSLAKFNFRAVSKLEKLNLSNNLLEEIDGMAFHKISLKVINLSGNSLRTLQQSVLSGMKFDEDGLIVNDNPWSCNCHLAWLKKLMSDTNYVSQDPPPLCNNEIGFENADFSSCSEIKTTPKKPVTTTTTTSTTTTTTSTTTTTTEKPATTTIKPITTTKKITESPITTTTINTSIITTSPNVPTTMGNDSDGTTLPPQDPKLIYIRCKFARAESADFPKDSDFITLRLMEEEIGIQYSLESFQLHIKFSGDVAHSSLLGFESAYRDKVDCFTRLQNHVVLEKLEKDTDYTFCLVRNDNYSVSPFSCFGLRTAKDYEKMPWILNEDRIIVIPATILVFAMSLVLCGFIVFFFIRQHPQLIKGNKRVIIVGSKGTDAMIMPRDFDGRDPAYVQPIYDKIKPRPSVRSRSMSVGSVMSYINAEPPTRKSTWKEAKADGKDNLDGYECVNLPPPLPPCHPLEQNIYDDTYLKTIS